MGRLDTRDVGPAHVGSMSGQNAFVLCAYLCTYAVNDLDDAYSRLAMCPLVFFRYGGGDNLTFHPQYEFYTIRVSRGEVVGGLASPNEPEVGEHFVLVNLLSG